MKNLAKFTALFVLLSLCTMPSEAKSTSANKSAACSKKSCPAAKVKTGKAKATAKAK